MDDKKELTSQTIDPRPPAKPNENPTVYIDAKIKIFEPESGQVLFQGRC